MAVWRVPTDDDWTDFTTYVNGYQSSAPDYDYRYNNEDGKIAKSLANTSGWDANATAGNVGNDQASNNATGFTAKPGGDRGTNGSFGYFGPYALFWSSSPSGSSAWRRGLYSSDSGVDRNSVSQALGFSVRLVRDDTGSDADGTVYTDDYTGNDGTEYDSVKIGDWVWLVENLKETKYADGTDIPRITDDTDWANDTTGARCEYNNDTDNGDEYGFLYNWYAVDNAKGLVAPTALYKNLQITNDNSAIRNRIYVRGGTYLSDTFTMSIVADGETTVFNLPEKPHDLTVTEGATSKTVGTKYIHEFTDYDYLLNYQEKYVETDTAPTADTVITFTFKYNIPVLVAVEDSNSIEAHGQAEFAIFDRNINTIEQARDRATAELTDYAETVIGGRFQTEINGFKAGQYMQITKSSLGIDDEFLVQRVVAKSIGGGNFVYTVYVTSATVLGILQFLVDLLEKDKNTLNITSDEVVDEITTIPAEEFTLTDGTPVLTTGTGTFEYGDSEYNLASYKPT